MTTGIKGIELIKQYEGCKLSAYLDTGKVPTIGYGNTYYENGIRVKIGDTITRERAVDLLKLILPKFEKNLAIGIKSKITQNQYDALICFCYNIGYGNFSKSTLLKKVNINPNDPGIRTEFMKWNKDNGKELTGLTRRRKSEADLYFGVIV